MSDLGSVYGTRRANFISRNLIPAMATFLPFLHMATAVDDCIPSQPPPWLVTDLDDDVLQI